MITEETTPLIVDLAKSFISLVRGIAPDWSKGYLRFCSQNSVSESKASYVHKSGVEIIDVLKFKDFFQEATIKGQELLATIGKSEGLFVLIVDSNLEYEIKFEYSDMGRWRISKMKGGTGIPEGLE
jgi:hypothetical protein